MEKLFSNLRKGVCIKLIVFFTFLLLSFTPLFAQMTWNCATNSAAWSDEVTVTLQNGVNNYTGCSDIHIGNEEDNPCSDGVNSGEYTKLVLTFFKC